MKSIAITSNHPRHISFIEHISAAAGIEKVFVEEKPAGEERFTAREKEFFKDCKMPTNISLFRCKKGEINSARIKKIIKEEKPDFIFTFGCSLLDSELVDIPSKSCVNIHTGLVQYHRGTDSSYWSIHEERPDRIGATVHVINNTIDAGAVLVQSNTRGISKDDNADVVFFKTCVTGFKMLKDNMKNILDEKIENKKLEKKGRLYQIKDMTKDIREEIEIKTLRVLMRRYNV